MLTQLIVQQLQQRWADVAGRGRTQSQCSHGEDTDFIRSSWRDGMWVESLASWSVDGCVHNWDCYYSVDTSKEALSWRLIQLLSEAEKQLEDKGVSSLSTLIKADQDKHIAQWKRRARILRKMKAGLDQLSKSMRNADHDRQLKDVGLLFPFKSKELPHSPNQARVEVVGERGAQLWWLQPETDSGAFTTKFKGRISITVQPDIIDQIPTPSRNSKVCRRAGYACCTYIFQMVLPSRLFSFFFSEL